MCKKIIFGILLRVFPKIVTSYKYRWRFSVIDNIIEDSCVEIREERKTVPTNFNEKKVTCKTKKNIYFFAFLLITVTLLIAVSVYYYLVKYWAKKKHLLPYHNTRNLEEIDIKNIL